MLLGISISVGTIFADPDLFFPAWLGFTESILIPEEVTLFHASPSHEIPQAPPLRSL